ncbi:hypothetical protein AGMMS49944_19740 [Spirochaetia bacterium]|nr:hypothetical protein AGMMS49944_19740 [Spirochaetia bacterium]
MALPNVTGTVIATGYNCICRAGSNASDAEAIAFITSFQANEDFQAQDAVVIGLLGPVSIDPQGYNCTINIASFIPAKKIVDGVTQYEDGGKKAIMDYIPNRAAYMEAGAIPKIAYLDFYNKKESKVIASFEGVLITSDGITVEGSQYVRGNVQMRALSKN